MIGKQTCDTLYFCWILSDSAVSHIVYKNTQLRWSGVWGVRGCGGERSQFKSVQVRTAGGHLMRCDYICSLTIFLLLCFFSLGSMQILQTLRVKIYTNRFQELYHCCIRLQVFSTLYQSNSGLWESLNIMQLQAMAVLALNFRFLLDFDNSKIGVQFGNKFSLCKVSIALQTIYSRYVYVLQLSTINVTL